MKRGRRGEVRPLDVYWYLGFCRYPYAGWYDASKPGAIAQFHTLCAEYGHDQCFVPIACFWRWEAKVGRPAAEAKLPTYPYICTCNF